MPVGSDTRRAILAGLRFARSYKDYVADAKKDGKKPMEKDEWEARFGDKGKGESKKEYSEDTPASEVKALNSTRGVPGIQKALDAIPDSDEGDETLERFEGMMSTVMDAKTLGAATEALENMIENEMDSNIEGALVAWLDHIEKEVK
jgi:hypothetical protein